MTNVKSCIVTGFKGNMAIVELDDGRRALLPSNAISDIGIPVDKKVYEGQRLLVCVKEKEDGGLWINHKCLMDDKNTFRKKHLGDTVKGRVVYSNDSGCVVELGGNAHFFVYGMCNLRDGVKVWASIKMNGAVDIDSVLYDERRSYYPEYTYNIEYDQYEPMAA